MTVLTSRRGSVVEPDREAILSAGAVGSPHILQPSGVGALKHLGRVAIAEHYELTGVGQNLQDYYIARISYPVQGVATINERSRGIRSPPRCCAASSPARAC